MGGRDHPPRYSKPAMGQWMSMGVSESESGRVVRIREGELLEHIRGERPVSEV